MARRHFLNNPHEDENEERLENTINQIRKLIEKCDHQLFTLSVEYGNKLNAQRPLLGRTHEIHSILNKAMADLSAANFKLMPLDPEGAANYHLRMGIEAEHERDEEGVDFHYREAGKYLQKKRRS